MTAPMPRLVPLACLLALLLAPAAAQAAGRTGTVKALSAQMRQAGAGSGAYVVDLQSGRNLYSTRAGTPRMPASVEKLYTSATAMKWKSTPPEASYVSSAGTHWTARSIKGWMTHPLGAELFSNRRGDDEHVGP